MIPTILLIQYTCLGMQLWCYKKGKKGNTFWMTGNIMMFFLFLIVKIGELT